MAQTDAPALHEWTAENGGSVTFDGVFYSYRSADGLRAFKMWTPPQEAPIRALLLMGNPGSGLGGDTRNSVLRQDWLQLGAREGLAVAGVTGFPGGETYAQHGRHIIEGLEAMAAHGRHPELAQVPLIVTGSSNAGFFAYSMLCLVPERTVAITPNVGGYFDLKAPKAAHAVPAWMHIGTLDPLVTDGVRRSEELFRLNDTGGNLLWAWDAEMKGHATEGSDHVDIAYWKAILDLRLPLSDDGSPPESMLAVDYADGWLADFETWDHEITRVFPATEAIDDREHGRYGWLPNEGIARLYQANASRARPLRLELVDDALGQSTEGTTGVFLAAGKSAIVEPGQEVTLRVTRVPLAFGLDRADIYDRGEKLGSVDVGQQGGTFTFVADGSKRLYALYAHTQQKGIFGKTVERISPPLLVLVRSSDTSERLQAQLEAYSLNGVSRARARVPETSASAPPETLPEDAPGAVRLDETVAAQFAPDGQLSAFWGSVQARSGGSGSAEIDAALRTKVAWSSSGLHFLFEDAGTAPGIDFHLASIDPQHFLSDAANPAHYTMPGLRQLLRSALQVQPEADGSSVAVNFWDPWDFRRELFTPETRFGGTGLWSDLVASSDGRTHLEFHLPWHLVGHPGFASAPAAGTRLTFMLSRAEADGKQRHQWPNGFDPWTAKPPETADGETSYGQLILLP
ncbi:MAG: hypothetical protein ACFB20_04685 [Opitutales bacterium]